jgi:hypothetical protein
VILVSFLFPRSVSFIRDHPGGDYGTRFRLAFSLSRNLAYARPRGATTPVRINFSLSQVLIVTPSTIARAGCSLPSPDAGSRAIFTNLRDFETIHPRRIIKHFVIATQVPATGESTRICVLEETERAMAVMIPARPKTTSGAPGFPTATSRQAPNVLRKSRSSTVGLPLPIISRRHSCSSAQEHLSKGDLLALDSEDMEISDISNPLGSHGYLQMADSLLSNKRAFSTTRPGATFDMAYFLRHTGPPATLTDAPAREPAKDDTKRVDRRKNRGGIFRKRQDEPDSETPTASGEQRPAIFVPPEGVEQKVTARGTITLSV